MGGSDSALPSEARDVAKTLDAIRSAVRKNAGYSSVDEVPSVSTSATMTAELAELATISAHLPVAWNTPIAGRALAYAKRGTRLLLRWYINPIVEQQNAFNEALVKAIATLDDRQRDIERRLTQDDQQE